MKKINYLLIGAAVLTLASCSQDDLMAPGQGDGNVNITVKLPADMATRALSDGLTADNLHIAVYDAATNNFVFETEANFGGKIQTTVSMNLPQKSSYNIAFFAVAPKADGTLYNFLPQGDDDYASPYIKVDYDNYASDDNLLDAYDCFFKMENIQTGTNGLQKDVILTRPVAQINWGTSDLSQAVVDESAFGANGKNLYSTLTIENAPYQYSFFEGVTSNTQKVTITGLASPASQTASAGWQFPVEPAVYKYIAMQYVLAPASQSLYNISLDAYNNVNQDAATVDNEVVEVNNAPLQANYRTNIYGALLTNPTEFTVIKDQWYTDDYDVDPYLLNVLANGGTYTLTEDIAINYPLVVSGNATINLNGNTITSNRAADGLFMVDGGNLTITGNGNIVDGIEDDDYQTLVWVRNGGTVTIEGGNFTAYGAGQAIYVENGTAYINGGTYKLLKDSSGDNWCLNCYDPNYKNQTAKIIVTGGTFYNWNPQSNNAEGANTNYLAQGYTVVTGKNGNDTLYTVVEEGVAVVNSVDELKNALNNAKEGDTIFITAGEYDTFPAASNLAPGVTIECQPGTEFTGKNSNVNLNGATVKGATFNYAERTSNDGSIKGTINANFEDCTFIGGNGARYTYIGAKEVRFTNCTFAGTAIYSFHTDGAAGGVTQPTVIFDNCDFDGFLALAGTVDSVYNSCTFTINKTSGYGGGNFYGNTTWNDCQFFLPNPTKDFQGIVLVTPGNSYILNNCYNEGELITVDFPFQISKSGVTVTCNGQSKTF